MDFNDVGEQQSVVDLNLSGMVRVLATGTGLSFEPVGEQHPKACHVIGRCTASDLLARDEAPMEPRRQPDNVTDIAFRDHNDDGSTHGATTQRGGQKTHRAQQFRPTASAVRRLRDARSYRTPRAAVSRRLSARESTTCSVQAERSRTVPVGSRLRTHGRTGGAGSGNAAPSCPYRRRGRGHLDDFLDRLRADGVLVRLRMSERNSGEITGYAVALATDLNKQGSPIYFGGGELARTSPCPSCNDAGTPAPAAPHPPSVRREADEPATAWTSGSTTSTARRSGSRRSPPPPRYPPSPRRSVHRPGGRRRHGLGRCDFLAAAARVVEGRRGGPLTAAADEYERAAREQWGRLPQPRHASHELRSAARLSWPPEP